MHRTFPELQLPPEPPAIRPSTSQEQSHHRMSKCVASFMQCLQRCSKVGMLFETLQHSKNASAHVAQLLANFSPNTLERYLKAVQNFLDFHLADGHCSYEVHHGILADFLFASQRSIKQDRSVHRTSPLISIKALRWWAKQCTWQELAAAMHSPLANAYSKDTQCKDTREAVPIPLAVTTAWERAVCDTTTPSSIKLFLGTALLCTHASVRFGDIQRTEWLSLQLSVAKDNHLRVHGTALQVATLTHRGSCSGCQS